MYIQYTMDQLFLPMDLEDDIPDNHLVRVVNAAVNRLDDGIFNAAYPGGGRDSYHPKMLTKVIIYAYTQRIYSSRQIAKSIRENIPFMWLAGRQRPDFRTINRFRSERMRDILEKVFTAVLQFLVEEKYVSLEHYFLDGTKIEANANCYTFVWGKSVSKHKMKLQENVHTLFATIEATEHQEEHQHQGKDLTELGKSSEMNSEKLEQLTQKLEAQLLEKPKDNHLKKAVRKLRKDLLPRLLKYEQYQSLLGDRNSFSKTDPDATFMRMKEDHMRNGQLKPGYNVQIGTENQFILAYSLHPRPTDTRCLEPHMEKARQILGKLPRTVIADAGYGSEENYAYLEKEKIQAVVKYGSYHKEKSKAWKSNVGKIENWTYNEAEDMWKCPAGQTLHFRKTNKETQPSGYEIQKRHYRSQNCEGCPLKERCTKITGNREVVVSLERLRYQEQAREILRSEEGLAYCNQFFAIEKDLIEATPEERLKVRAEQSCAVLVRGYDNKDLKVMPKSLTRQAIAYSLNQWEKLTAFMNDGRLETDNNRSERSIKPFVIGRKNWMFANTPRGATASYSLTDKWIKNIYHLIWCRKLY